MAFSGSVRPNRARNKGRPAAQERVRRRQRRPQLSSTAFDSGKKKIPYCYCVRTSRNGTERTVPPVSLVPPPPAPPGPPPEVSQEEVLIIRATTSLPLTPSRKIEAKPMTCTVTVEPPGNRPQNTGMVRSCIHPKVPALYRGF